MTTTTTQHPIDTALDRIHALGWHESGDLTAIMREVYDAGRASTTQSATELVQWQQVARVWVAGNPTPQPRPKAVRMGKLIRIYTPDPKGKLKAWKDAIARASLGRKPAAPVDCAVRVDLTLYCERPKSLMRKRDPDGPALNTTRPDRDNYEKAILDAMTDCGWWTDDSRVCAGESIKLYHAKTGEPGALIVVSVPEDEQQDLFQQGS